MPKLSRARPPVLDALESTASVDGKTERLSDIEFLMLEQLMRFPEQPITRDSLRSVIGFDDENGLPDRRLDNWLRGLIRKTNVLNPLFPVVRQDQAGNYLFTLVPPLKKSEHRR